MGRFTPDDEVGVPVEEWSPERRDEEFGKIRGLTTAVGVAAVGVCVVFGAAVAWGDHVRGSLAGTEADFGTGQGTQSPSLAPPTSSPSPASPSPKPKPTRSGGS